MTKKSVLRMKQLGSIGLLKIFKGKPKRGHNPKRPPIICRKCKKSLKHRAHGLCYNCYQAEYRSTKSGKISYIKTCFKSLPPRQQRILLKELKIRV
jgi:hypothetical protein